VSVADIPDGMISPGDAAADALGFTLDRWSADSYLWRTGDELTCSLMIANEPGKGAFKALVAAIEGAGLKVAVPTPSERMRAILTKWGFVGGWEPWPEMGEDVEIWRRP